MPIVAMSSEFRDRLKAAIVGAVATALLSGVGYGYAQFATVQTAVATHSEQIKALEQRQTEIHTDVREIRRLLTR